MTSPRSSLAALAVAGVSTIAAAWQSQMLAAAFLVSLFCIAAALVVSRSFQAAFGIFSLGQPVAILAWYLSPLLSLLLEAGMMTVLLHSLGQLSSARQRAGWAAAVLFLFLAVGMIGTVRHVLAPLVISLVIAAVAGIGIFFSSYRISHGSPGGFNDDQTV